MDKKPKTGASTEKVEVATNNSELTTNIAKQASNVAEIDNGDASFRAAVEPQIAALTEKIFEIDEGASIGGDKGAIGYAIDLLSDYKDLMDLDAKSAPSEEKAGSFDIAMGEMQKQIVAISTALQPLAQYLKAEGFLSSEPGLIITVADIAEAAVHGLQVRKANVSEMQVKVDELTPDPSQLPKRKFKAISMPDKVDEDAFNTASVIVFADESGNVINDLPPLSFAADQYLGSHIGRTLNAPIDFPVHVPAHAVASVFLVDPKGKPVGVSEMVMPLNVGGGKSARINAGSLLFRAPEKEAAEEVGKAA